MSVILSEKVTWLTFLKLNIFSVSCNTDQYYGVKFRVSKTKVAFYQPASDILNLTVKHLSAQQEENMQILFLINWLWTLSIIISIKVNREVCQITSTVAINLDMSRAYIYVIYWWLLFYMFYYSPKWILLTFLKTNYEKKNCLAKK